MGDGQLLLKKDITGYIAGYVGVPSNRTHSVCCVCDLVCIGRGNDDEPVTNGLKALQLQLLGSPLLSREVCMS